MSGHGPGIAHVAIGGQTGGGAQPHEHPDDGKKKADIAVGSSKRKICIFLKFKILPTTLAITPFETKDLVKLLTSCFMRLSDTCFF